MADAAEVLVKLMVDSNAPKATAELQRGLEKVEPHRKSFVKGLVDGRANMNALGIVGKVALGYVAAGAAFAGGALIGAAVGATHAFLESQEQVRALAGTITLLDTSGTSFEKVTDIASDLKDELEEVAMAAGMTDDALVAAFTDVIERGGKTIDQASKLTEQMAKAGRAVPGGIGTISGAFEQIEMGAVRARNPIVGMIAATHLLKGNAKQVAAQMQKMTPEEQMKLAEKAISNMAKKMEAVPLSIGEMTTSMRVFVGNLFEDAGKPIVDNLVPVFSMVRGWLMENQGTLKGVAKAFGDTMGRAVEVALPVAREVFSAIKASSGDIKSMADALYGPGKELFSYIYENREAFATTIGDVLKLIISATATLVKGIAAVRDGIIDAVAALSTVKIAGVPMFGKALPEMMAGETTKKARSMILAGDTKLGVSEDVSLKEKYTEQMMAAGKDRQEAEAMFDSVVQRATADHTATMDSVAGLVSQSVSGNAEAFAAAYDLASREHDVGAQNYVAKFLDGNQRLQDALVEKGPEIFKTGFSGFVEQLEKMGAGDIAKKLSEGMSATARGTVAVGKGPQVNQYIGTVNVKQDFKDIDPERVAIVFRNDLAKHGVSRLQPIGAKAGGF